MAKFLHGTLRLLPHDRSSGLVVAQLAAKSIVRFRMERWVQIVAMSDELKINTPQLLKLFEVVGQRGEVAWQEQIALFRTTR